MTHTLICVFTFTYSWACLSRLLWTQMSKHSCKHYTEKGLWLHFGFIQFLSFLLPQHLFAAEIFLGPRGEHILLLTVVQSRTIADLKGKLSKPSGQCSGVNQLRYQSTFITPWVLTLQRTRSQIMWSHNMTYSLLFGVIVYLDKQVIDRNRILR